jgi:hypothetical protein
MKSKIFILMIISFVISHKALTQTDTNLTWVYRQAELTQKFLERFNYYPTKSSTENNSEDFQLSVPSQIKGQYMIRGKMIMNVSKTKNLGKHNYCDVLKEQIIIVINENDKEYFMLHRYYLTDGRIQTEWFRYQYIEAKMMYDTLSELVQ